MADIIGVAAVILFLAVLIKERKSIIKSRTKRDKRMLGTYLVASLLLTYYSSTTGDVVFSSLFFVVTLLVIVEIVYLFIH